MTKVKPPHKMGGLSPSLKIVAATVTLLLVAGALLLAFPDHGHPKEPLVRSSSPNTVDHKKIDSMAAAAIVTQKKQTTPHAAKVPAATPGVHRYEMKLALLQTDDTHPEPHGTVILETYDDWAPLGAAHFHELVTKAFYDECRFFRVLNNFVVQFGINGDPAVQRQWRKQVLKDDPVKVSLFVCLFLFVLLMYLFFVSGSPHECV